MRSQAVLSLLALCGNALGARLAIPEVRNLDLAQRDSQPILDKRITCLEDDYLLSFQMYIEDSYPSCSAYLGIPETTSFAAGVTKATVVVLRTTFQTFQQQVTVPAGTTTVTTTEANTLAGPTFKKRQDNITPAAVVFAQCADATGLNASLIRSVSSACSCLFITERVNVVTTTSIETRIIPGIDYEQTTQVETVTGPTTTVLYTVKPTTFGPNPSSSGSLVQTGLPTGPPVSSSVPAPSSNGTSVFYPSSLPFSSYSSGSISSVSIPVGTSSSSSSTGPSGSVASSPTSSTIPIGSSSIPGFGNSTTIPVPTGASTTSSSPVGTPTISTGPRGGPSVPSSISNPSTIIPSSPISSAIISTGNSTSAPGPTSTGGHPVSSDCPSSNGTIYTSQCQNFLIECYTNYGGPVTEGLVERTLYGCVDDCAIANVGFSQSRCYAASYFPNVVGPNCFFKTQKDSLTPLDNEKTISALLLNPGNSSVLGCPTPSNSTKTRTKSVPIATGSSLTLSSKATTMTGNSTTPWPSSAPASGSKSSSLGNGTSLLSTGTAPQSSGTAPTPSYTRPFSGTAPTGTIPTLPAGNSTATKPSGQISGTVPPFTLPIPSQSRIDNQNSTTPATSCPSTKCTSLVYSTSTVYFTSLISLF